jgi:hypothetical protein
MTASYSNKTIAFIPFIESCEMFLGFLVKKHFFSKSEPRIMPPECWIEYRKSDIELDVIYEYGDYPWIRITINGKDNSLDNIIKKKWPNKAINRKKGPSDPDKRIVFALEKYSHVLQEHISELT